MADVKWQKDWSTESEARNILNKLGITEHDVPVEQLSGGQKDVYKRQEIVGIIVYFASPVFIAAFNNDPKVIAFGVKEAHIITLFYFLLAFSHCIAGLMRGAGRATVPMFVMLGCWCVIRVTYITIAVKLHPVIQTVFWAYPLTWSLSSILFLIFYLKSDWIHGFEKKRN